MIPEPKQHGRRRGVGHPVRNQSTRTGPRSPARARAAVRGVDGGAKRRGRRDGTIDQRLDAAVNGLLRRSPEMSASWTLRWRQRLLIGSVVAAVAIALVVSPVRTLIVLNAIGTAGYLGVLLYNLRLFQKVIGNPGLVTVTDEEARAIPDDMLPMYTVLVPAFHEAEVIGDAIHALSALDYPASRLQILVLLEADDEETYQAALAAEPNPSVEIVRVPYALPRTKPKACNFGLSGSAGDLVTIYDAEDRPEPLQLRRAAAAFRRLDPSVICLQARLQYHNVGQNLLTRWFSAEYLTWFSGMVPALVEMDAPIPLGGTSMHLRRGPLEAIGGWDPYNVTEDADLGIRLHRMGYRTRVLDSVTYEEANSDVINWFKQRSRWYKGYLQTWLVHLRHPLRLWRELGPSGFVHFNVLVGATPILALLNPVFWLMIVLWFVARPGIIQLIFPAWLFYPAMLSLLLGNFIAFYRTLAAVRAAGHPGLVFATLVSPLYWVLMSIAAVRACLQLVIAPSFWEKTTHGLERPVDPAAARRAA